MGILDPVSNEIIFDPIKWSSREIVLQTNVDPIVSGSSKIVRKFQRLQTKPVKLKFRFNQDIEVSGEGLALALSTLCGKSFDSIRFGFEIPESTKNDIAKWTESDVRIPGTVSKQNRELGGTVLNFSGGFDSLAAHYLLPPEQELVSLDFGGRFSREKKFFSKFSPLEVQTNVVKTSLRKHSWSFIGMAALLSMEKINPQYCTFGSIIESTGFKRKTAHEKGFTFPPFASAGMQNAPTTQGISEFGTALVIAEYAPELLEPSLNSLASPGEEKLFRKWALAKTALEQAGRPVPFSEVKKPDVPHYEFGQRLVIDLTAMMAASFGNEDVASQLVRGLSSEIIRDANAMNFDFMFKADKRMYANYPSELKPALENGLERAEIDWYTAQDRENVKSFREYWQSKSQKSG